MQRKKSHAFLLMGLITLALVSSSHSVAAPLCQSLFKERTAEAQRLSLDDAFRQWIKWEQTSNVAKFRKPENAIEINAIEVSKDRMEIERVEHLDPQLVRELRLDRDRMLWIKHPYNTSSEVPFLYDKNHARSFTAYFTASRSMVLDGFENAYTLKMPSDRPHGPYGVLEPKKANTRDDIVTGLTRTRHIDTVDQLIGKDSRLIVAREVLTVAEKGTGQGYLVRDVSFMKDGHYYLPAFSLPYAGRDIAKLHGKEPETFWREHYAAALGRTKAQLLLRYGLQMETPNTQNILIQLDRNLLPTGRIVLRDLSDSFFVKPVAEALGFKAQMEHDLAVGYKAHDRLEPFWENSAWRLDEAGELSYSGRTLSEWGSAHNNAYRQEIENTTGVSTASPVGHSIWDAESALFSEIALRRLSRFQQDRANRERRSKEPIQPKAGNGFE